jgi:uncharacterized protein
VERARPVIAPLRGILLAAGRFGGARWTRRGLAAHKSRRYFRALEAWRKASARGDAQAQFLLGRLYARGEGVLRSIADAAACYRRAAEAGHAEAAFHLGLIYLSGADPFAGPSQGWFRAVARRDDEGSRRIRDALFPNGVGVEKDVEAALRWLNRAVAAGLPEAQAVMGDLRRRGAGGEPDFLEARRLYELAAERDVA